MSAHNSFVANYIDSKLAELDLEKIQSAGFDMSKFRIISRYKAPSAKRYSPLPVLHSFGDLDVDFIECIPEEDLVDYESELATGHLFVVAHGLPEEVEQAKRVADATHPASWDGIAESTVYYGCAD